MTKRDLFTPPPALEPAREPSAFAKDVARARAASAGASDPENEAFLASPAAERMRARLRAEVAARADAPQASRDLQEARVETDAEHEATTSRQEWQRALAARRRRLAWTGGVVTALAASVAIVLAVTLPRGTTDGAVAPGQQTPLATPYDHDIGTKGASSLTVFRKRGADVARVTEGAELFAGDRLRFSYATKRRFLLVVDVEERGGVLPFYPYPGSSSLRLAAERGSLQGSIELNESAGDERIVAVFSDAPLRFDDVAAALERAYPRDDGGGPRALSRPAPLELDADVVTLRFVKRAAAPR